MGAAHPSELCRDSHSRGASRSVAARSGIWAQAPGLGWHVDVGAIIPEMGFKACVRLKEEAQGLSPAHPTC